MLAAEVNLLIKQFVWDLDTKAFYNTERKSKDTIYGVRISPRQKQTGACQGGGPTQVVQNIGGPVRGDSWPTKWQVIVEKSLKSAKCGKSAGGNLKSWVSRKVWGKYDGSVEKPSKFLKVRWDFLLFYMSKRCFRGTVILGLCIRETCCFAINRPLTDPPKKGVLF